MTTPAASVPYTRNTVALRFSGRRDELPAGATLYPGMLLEHRSDTKCYPHSVFAGPAERMFALEDALQGHWLLDAYSSGDPVQIGIFYPGDIVRALLNAGALAVTEGDLLVSNGDGTVAKVASGDGEVLYDNTADSAAVTNTTTETTFDKSYTIPANTLKAGDVIHIHAQAIATATNNADTLTVKLKLGSTVIANTGAVDVANNDAATIDATLIIRSVGATGTLVAEGWVSLGVPGTATTRAFAVASTTIDTTATQAITVTGQWSAADANDSALLRILAVEKSTQAGEHLLGKALEDVDNSLGSNYKGIAVRLL